LLVVILAPCTQVGAEISYAAASCGVGFSVSNLLAERDRLRCTTHRWPANPQRVYHPSRAGSLQAEAALRRYRRGANLTPADVQVGRDQASLAKSAQAAPLSGRRSREVVATKLGCFSLLQLSAVPSSFRARAYARGEYLMSL